ncbi:MAG: hypothetical protein RL033_1443 [Pseudomonadota bacterium]|jgi:fibro-slime domain-containing protein
MKIVPAARFARRARFHSASFTSASFAALGLLAAVFVASCGAGGEDTDPEVAGPRLNPDGTPVPGNGGSATGGTFVGQDCMGEGCNLAGGELTLPPGCGNGVLTDDEACDDGNKASGDGCAEDCLLTEAGFSCPNPGQACQQIALCGDGERAANEQCDDGNPTDGDGCSARCRVELGFKCDKGTNVCVPEECGNGDMQGAESCDDGNTVPFDGCSSLCQKEPNCTTPPCTSDCGDGLVINEACDDGNTIDGDGCSSTCTVESGFVCNPQAACDLVGDQCALRVPAIFRDFSDAQPNFGGNECQFLTQGAVGQQLNADGHPVLVGNATTLAGSCLDEGTPQDFLQWYSDSPNSVRVVGELTLFENETGGYVNRYGANGEKWSYVDGTGQRGNFASLAACEAGCLNEAQNAQGMFTGQGQLRCADQCRQLNDQVQQRTNGALQQLNNQLAQALIANPPVQATIDLLTAQVAAEEANIADLQQQALDCQTTCQTELDGRVAECVPLCGPCAYPNPAPFCLGGTPLTRDGTPLFFPVDSVTGPTANRERATIPEQYGYNGFPFEDVVFEGAPPHNFYFTTEVEYWFQYNANTQATLTFVGDDDVWVFLNGRLAVDLGGLHVPSTGTVTINGANDQVRLVATDDRLPVTATLVRQNQLLSTGDFGLADGGVYKISIFHAERQLTGSSFQLTLAGFERQPSNCEANCGDGILSFGEECDDTINDGDYGECGPNCKLGPFCGDRIVQKDLGESCDEGPRGSASCRGCRIVILR